MNRLPLWPMAILSVTAQATTYMSEADAVKVLYPGLAMTKSLATLSKEDVDFLKEKVEGRIPKAMTVYRGPKGETVYVDQVLGKHELITYAVALNEAGAVKGLEIIEYRESYGFEVRRPNWRDQFKGKNGQSKLELDEDIKNISGATLSASHITQGVKRILLFHERHRSST